MTQKFEVACPRCMEIVFVETDVCKVTWTRAGFSVEWQGAYASHRCSGEETALPF